MDFSLCSSLFLSAPEGIRTPRHLASENYDAAHNSMIYSNFLLVLHHSGTPITNNIKQCVNDKN